MAEFTESKRGRRKLLFQGYIYVLDRDMGEKTYWRCEKRKICRGRANSMGSQVLETTPHCHARDQAECEVLEIVNEVKMLASTTGAPAEQIVSDTVQNLDASVAAKLPSNRSLTRLIRRLRQSKGLSRKRRHRDNNTVEYPLMNVNVSPELLKKPKQSTIASSDITYASSLTSVPVPHCYTNSKPTPTVTIKVKQSTIPCDSNEEKYFRSYSNLAIHSDMIGDMQRTSTYRHAILSNYPVFYGKTVADVGCGTGVLSVFCIKAGAKKVYAIEASDIVEETRKVVAANGMEDKIVVLHGKAEDIELPETVDVIVSEWMGYMLLFESMLQSVLHVRDRWLKQHGKMFPEKAQLFLAPITDSIEFAHRVEFWKTVKDTYDIDMAPLSETAMQELCKTVSITSVAAEDVHSHASSVFEIELSSVLPCELNNLEGVFRCPCFGHGNVLGFAVWFTVTFPGGLTLTTSPYEDETHWRQAVLHIVPLPVQQDSILEGTLVFRQSSKDHRCLDVDLEYSLDGHEIMKRTYKMNNEI